MKSDCCENRLLGKLGAYLGEGRGARLLVAVDQQNVAATLRENGGDIDG